APTTPALHPRSLPDALPILTKLSILKGILGSYLSRSSSSASSSRSNAVGTQTGSAAGERSSSGDRGTGPDWRAHTLRPDTSQVRSEEHTSELQSRFDLVCRH